MAGAYTVDTLGGGGAAPDPADRQARGRLLRTLAAHPPGYWQSDHRSESAADTGLVYVAVRAKSDAMSAATIQVTKLRRGAVRKAMASPAAHTRDHDRVPVPAAHPLQRLFDDPNERDTTGDLLADVVTQLDLTGTALLYHPPNRRGRPCRLWPIPTGLTQAVAASPQYPAGGWRVDWLASGVPLGWGFGSSAVLPADQCVALQHRHPLHRWDGYSPVKAGDQIIDAQRAMDAGRKASLDQAFSPDAIVTLDGASQEEVDRVQALIDQRYTGPRGRRVYVASAEGADATRTGTSPKEMDYPQSYDQLNRIVMAVFGVSATVAGVTEADSYASLYAKLTQFYEGTLRHLAAKLSGWLTKHLARRFWGRAYAVTVCVAAPTDPTRLDATMRDGLTAGAVKVNEWRGTYNLDPLADGDEMLPVFVAKRQRQFAPPPPPVLAAADPSPKSPETGPPRPANPAGKGSLPPRPQRKAMPSLARYARQLVKAAGRSRLTLTPDPDDEEPEMGNTPDPFFDEASPDWTITPASGHLYRFRFVPAKPGSTAFAEPRLYVQFWKHAPGSTKENPTREMGTTGYYTLSNNEIGAEYARKMADTLHPWGDVGHPLLKRAGVPWTKVSD